MRSPGVEPGSQAWKACRLPLPHKRLVEWSASAARTREKLDSGGPKKKNVHERGLRLGSNQRFCLWRATRYHYATEPGLDLGFFLARSLQDVKRLPAGKMELREGSQPQILIVVLRLDSGQLPSLFREKEAMRAPGIEPGSQAWEACIMPLD